MQGSENLRDLFIYKALSDAQVQQYNELGYHRYGRILTDTGLQRMREECMAAWRADKGEFDPNKTWLHNALLVNIHHRSSVVRRYYFEGPLVDVAEQLLGPNIKGATSQLTFKMRGNNKPFHWHQDNGYGQLDPYNAISCLTALDHADVENGCLWIIPGSHLKGQVDVGAAGTAEAKKAWVEIKLDADETKALPMPLKAGECLFFHGWTLHKSEGNLSKDRDRRILFLRYADADAVEVYNNRAPRLGRLVRGTTKFPEVRAFEADLA
ncbi:MAG: phytanoyl-CoA dioxygenase family protein [Planctomycetes bacterium]|nr:phytanoyl-CoA dioxygenase family protein [Planctomycetota bacterium]